MIALDTNVLVRFLVNDDQRQAALAEKIFEECRKNREQVFISSPVLCELCWVLERSYELSRPEIATVLERLMATDLFKLERAALVRRGLAHFKDGKGSFADYLIGEIGLSEGCTETATFDKGLKGAPGFRVLTA